MTCGYKVESAVDVGALIRRARQAAVVTQQHLADRVGATRQCVIRLKQRRHGTAINAALIALKERLGTRGCRRPHPVLFSRRNVLGASSLRFSVDGAVR